MSEPTRQDAEGTDTYFAHQLHTVHQHSVLSTPNGGQIVAAPSIGTPDGSTTPELSDTEQTVTTSTITTTVTKNGLTDGSAMSSTARITHVGAKGVTPQVSSDGHIHLRPTPASTSRGKRIRAIVSFRPRQSHFDRENRNSSSDQFRGFFTLFWISLSLFVLNTFYTSFANTGQLLSMTFATLFSKDARMLALSDAVLLGHLFLCVPFVKICQRGWVRYWPVAVVVQHLWQSALLFAVIKWARYREWPWVQSGFFVLHTLTMMMKIHSYMAINGNLADAFHRIRRLEIMLEEKVAEVEGQAAGHGPEQLRAAWNKAVSTARINGGYESKAAPTPAKDELDWSSLDLQRGSSANRLKRRPAAAIASDTKFLSNPADPNPKLDMDEHKKLHQETTEQGKALRQRPKATSQTPSTDGRGKEQHAIRDPHPLSTHPDALIADLACEIEVLREDLLSARYPEVSEPGIVKQDVVVWPENVTYANFFDYLLVPTLVYELSYPRTLAIRPLLVLEKTLATFGTFLVIYVITEHWIMPNCPKEDTPLLRSFLQLAVPMMVNYLLIFYLIFEGVLGGFAEITRFADREFYQDWWNATSMDMFSRKWNKPVHSFLLRHVYASTIAAWGLSKTTAMFVTFLFSSLVHELVMAIVSGKIRLYLFSAQMSQLPLILISQIPFVKRNEALGNMIFWIGLMMGFPLLNIGYLVY